MINVAPLLRSVVAITVALPLFFGGTQAFGEWRDDVPVLRVGLFGTGDTAGLADRWEGWRRFVERRMGVPTDLVLHDDYGTALRALATGQVEYMALGATGYLDVLQVCGCVEPLVVVEDEAGSTGYRSFIITLAGSGLTTLQDLEGRRITFPAPDSTAGYFVPTTGLIIEGIDPERFFGDIRFSGGYSEGVELLLDEMIDATVIWASDGGDPSRGYSSGIMRQLVEQDLLPYAAMNIVWQSPVIPGGAGVVRNDLPQETRDLMRGVLTAMPFEDPDAFSTAEGGSAARYQPVGRSSYAILEAMRTTLR